jgi:tetrahydromethanopterin S-methyltransferase subunit G
MLKDILENLLTEIKNEKNQEYVQYIFEPVYNKIKITYSIIVLLLLIIIINLIYVSTKIHLFKICNCNGISAASVVPEIGSKL